MAHGQAHARHRHDRFKLSALVTTTFVPPLRPVQARLDFHLERWAASPVYQLHHSLTFAGELIH